MKKSIIAAGAASVALAAMPIVSTFATGGPFTDVIQTTIGDSCTFSRGAHTTAANWNTDGTDTNKDILDPVTVTIGDPEATLGTSTFGVVCNDPDGYQVTVATNPLTLTSGTNTHAWAYNAGPAPSTPAASYWRLSSDNANADLDSSKNIVAKKTSAEDNGSFTITYYAYAHTGQDAGTYSANVTYTFAQL